MAGMLAGVECARRRRFHQSGGVYSDSAATSSHSFSRRSSFCLYPTNHDSHLISTYNSSLQRNTVYQGYHDEKLGGLAGEAKERLNERLRSLSDGRRYKNKEKCNDDDNKKSKQLGDLQIEIIGLKKSVSKRFNWAKLNWKAVDQDECAVCLENFRGGETLARLPCAHRFHSKCLVPWLETNAHCPCCRMGVQSFSL